MAIITYNNIKPKINENSFIASTSIISGNVTIDEGSGIWYGTVIRGDVSPIKIGKNTNIQDNTVIHGTRPNHVANKTGAEGAMVTIGDNVTVGHSALIHACTIEDNAFVGMNATMMDLSIVEEYSMLAAGALLSPHKVVKKHQLWAGVPAKYIRNLTQEEIDYIKISADNYNKLAMEYKLVDK